MKNKAWEEYRKIEQPAWEEYEEIRKKKCPTCGHKE